MEGQYDYYLRNIDNKSLIIRCKTILRYLHF